MDEPSLIRRILAGRTGPWSAPIRAALSAAEGLYAGAVERRNRAYDRGEGVRHIDAPVISIGNLTAGGTGKTPLVVYVASCLERLGCSPAVVARGYGARSGEPNDEERLIRLRVPGVAYVADADRVRGAEEAVRRFGADVVVLDDGFQHRRLARDLDVVLIDATCPFGFERLLPRGLLREPIGALARADVIILTRADQVSGNALDRITGRIRKVHPEAPVLKCRHRVAAIEHLDGTPWSSALEGLRVVAFAGVAHPVAFLTTLRSLGVEVVGVRWWPDHHAYRPRDIEGLLRSGRFPPYDVLMTTEKDAVKLRGRFGALSTPILVVRVAVDFMEDDGTIFDAMLARVVEQRRTALVPESGH